jgi:argininosuccinate lyase
VEEKQGKGTLLDAHRKEPMSETVVKFLSSINEDLWIAEVDVRNSIAHNMMLIKQNIVPEAEGKQIIKALVEILNQIKSGTFKVDPSFEDIHPFIEKLVIEKTGMSIGGKLHTGRSRNDQVATDIRMKIREEIFELCDILYDCIHTIVKQSEMFADALMPLYTHVQRGQIGTFGHVLQSYAFQLLRIFERLNQTFDRINLCPLGACAIGGTSMPLDRRYTAELLGFDGIIFNSIDAISSRDFISETLSVLADLAVIASRIAEDFILWNSEEFGFIIIDDAYASVSSAMPQKKNPDTLEIIRGRCGKVIGALIEAQIMQKGTPSGYNRDFQESKPPLILGFNTAKNSLKILTGVIETLKIRKDRMVNAILNSGTIALDISEYLVKHHNVPFRQAHQIMGALSKNLQSMSPEQAYHPEKIAEYAKNNLGLEISIDHEIKNLLDPAKALSQRISEGSPTKENIIKGKHLILESVEHIITELKKKRTKIIETWKFMEQIVQK